MKDLQDKKLDENNLNTELQKRLKIPKTKANNLAEDIKERFLQPMLAEGKPAAAPLSEKPVLESKQKKETSTDVYREQIE